MRQAVLRPQGTCAHRVNKGTDQSFGRTFGGSDKYPASGSDTWRV
jgi:hypothetical protein